MPQERVGAVEAYGPGIVGASSRALRFVLARPASVIVLQVSPNGIEVVIPRHSADRTEFAAGEHRIDATVESTLYYDHPFHWPTPLPRPIRVSPPDSTYWILIVADVQTSARELRLRLGPMDISDGDLATVLQQLPGALVGRRTELWAAYYAPVVP